MTRNERDSDIHALNFLHQKYKMINRKILYYKLTISELVPGTDYDVVFYEAFRGASPQHVFRTSSKEHVLWEVMPRKSGTLFRFASYRRGFRPDVIDTDRLEVMASSLRENQTNVDWTHAFGGYSEDQYILLLAYNHYGLQGSTLERYLQEWIDVALSPDVRTTEPPLVTLERVPGRAFIERLEAQERVRRARLRYVRPNPGWLDLEDALGEEAADSNAARADVEMTAPRGGTLAKTAGIVERIMSLFGANDLDYAEIEGTRDGRRDVFNTRSLGKQAMLQVQTTPSGQDDSVEIAHKLETLFEEDE